MNAESLQFKRPRARLLAAVVAIALPLAALVVGARAPDRSDAPSNAKESSPRQCLENMLSAEKKGDVAAYLACFSGPLREELAAQAAADSGRALIERLRNAAAELTGHATTELEMDGSDQAAITLERIFERETETSRIRFRRAGNAWTIVAVESPQRSQSPIPYGTPVVPE